MSRYSKHSFFYQQKKRSFSSRRPKKHFDTQSVLGEKRESILIFRPGAAIEEELGNVRLQAKSPGILNHRQRRPSSAASRKSSVWFPPLDTTGPHLTTTKTLPEEDFPIEEDQIEKEQPSYKFSEIKIASTAILSNLSRRLESITGSAIGEVEVPESLVNSLILSFHQLVVDTIVERREWQTDCYLDYKPRNRLFLTDTPQQGDPVRQKVEASLNHFVKQQESSKSRKRKRAMSEEKEKLERPLTAKSTMSAVSMKSEASNISEADSKVDYDKLPPELRMQGPEILRHRRESKAPKPKIPGPRTRLEKFNFLKQKANQERKLKRKKAGGLALLPNTNKQTIEGIEEHDTESVRQVRGMQMINFSMSSKECADHGWIVHPSKTADPEGFTLYQWANTRLQEAMRQREESHLTAKLRGEDGPLVVKYYSDPHYRPFKGARHRTASFPLPAVLNKLPPSVATFTSHTHNDVFFSPGEGQTLCLLLLPDGSGFCNYYSGRRAISSSRKGDGSKGLYVVVFDDTKYNNVIGYFMPDGRVSCYHRNGGLHLLTNSDGGILMDEEGYIARQWSWPKNGEKMPYSISIQLNTHVLFQCSGEYQMMLRFSCHGQMHRFPVGLKPEFIDSEHKNEAFWMKRSTVISSRLQSDLPFQSEAAKQQYKDDESESSHWQQQQKQHLATSGVSKLPHSRELGVGKEKQLNDSLSTSLTGSLSKFDSEPTRKELEQYRSKIRSVVDDWLNYYRQTIGISPPSRLSQSSVSQNLRLLSSQGTNRASSTTATHYILQQQFASSTGVIETPTTTRPTTPAAGLAMDEIFSPRSASPLEQYIKRPQSQEIRRPFKVGPAKPKQRPPIRFRPGCPMSLHTMILRKMDEMPQCRCDKRKIPLIRDLEFDLFLSNHIPPGQLIIVFVTSSISRVKKEIPCHPLLQSLHERQNTNRYAPCQQSGRDIFRVLQYNLDMSVDDLSTCEPLLITRHNIAIGMFLMYMAGKLVGIFTGFNGYGTTKKDFLKQVQRSLENGSKGQFLPRDFKFSHSSVKLHSNSLWAYPVSGVLDEFVSLTPPGTLSSSSSVSLRRNRIIGCSPNDGKSVVVSTEMSQEDDVTKSNPKIDFIRED